VGEKGEKKINKGKKPPTKKKKKRTKKKKNSKAGNRTRVSCVTGRNTNHYTTSEVAIKLCKARMAQWIRRLPTEQEIPGSSPGMGYFLLSIRTFIIYFLNPPSSWRTNGNVLGFDHINRNAPVLIRTPKLTRFEPAQYWGGGPPGNSVVLNPFFFALFCLQN
jgi:hypothetical protein